jgi:hypothetical protein
MTRKPTIAIVGGGITGLSAAAALASGAADGVRVVLIEGERRLGGKIRTEELEGRPMEAGPDGLLARVPWAVSLCEELGPADDLIPAAAQGAHLCSRGRLRPLPAGLLVLGLPTSPLATIRSGILSPWGVLRAGADLILPNRMPSSDVSVGTLVRYRLGRRALERLVDPLLGGVYAGCADELSLRAAAPQIDAVLGRIEASRWASDPPAARGRRHAPGRRSSPCEAGLSAWSTLFASAFAPQQRCCSLVPSWGLPAGLTTTGDSTSATSAWRRRRSSSQSPPLPPSGSCGACPPAPPESLLASTTHRSPPSPSRTRRRHGDPCRRGQGSWCPRWRGLP